MGFLGFLALPDWVILAVTAVVLLYMYITRRRNYWKNQNITYEPVSLLQSFKTLFEPYHIFDVRMYKKHGKMFGIFEGMKPMLILSDPELLKQVLVKDFAELPERRRSLFMDPLLDNMMSVAPPKCWKKVRQASSPAFSTGRLSKMIHLVEDCARVTAGHLRKVAKERKDIDAKKFFSNYALDIIARCAFGTHLDSYDDETSEFVQKADKAFSGSVSFRLILFVLCPGIFKLLGIKPANTDLFYFFKDLSLRIAKQRQDTNTRHEDFLQLMIDAQQDAVLEPSESTEDPENTLFDLKDDKKPQRISERLTEDEALSQCVMFFFAGLGTTSSTLAFASYMLALNPACQTRLREEIDACFQKHGDRPPWEAVSKLAYLDGVICETLRMFPIASRLERTATEDYTLADTGITLPKDCIVAIPVHAMHHDPEYFPDPEQFDPERFITERASCIRPYTYLPFGAGPRNCIGMRFALQSLKLCLLYAVRNAEFVPTANTKIPLEYRSGYPALMVKDITVGVRQRS
ncbi:cytochrome P450 3A2-like [Ornithodoros turicata]|uniref:cytochrome P450 3A2-like n=1 Tax=Ornithodoros turicata TaxID=34597 RepID=UPI003138EFFD